MEKIEESFSKIYQKLSSQHGMDTLFSKIYSLSYISPNDISLEELSKKTGYSLATISTKVKMLETMGLIRKVKKPGEKKVYIRCEKNTIKVFRDITLRKQEIGITFLKNEIPKIIEQNKKNLNYEQKAKIKILQDYYKQILLMEKITEKIVEEFNKALKEYEK